MVITIKTIIKKPYDYATTAELTFCSSRLVQPTLLSRCLKQSFPLIPATSNKIWEHQEWNPWQLGEQWVCYAPQNLLWQALYTNESYLQLFSYQVVFKPEPCVGHLPQWLVSKIERDLFKLTPSATKLQILMSVVQDIMDFFCSQTGNIRITFVFGSQLRLIFYP